MLSIDDLKAMFAAKNANTQVVNEVANSDEIADQLIRVYGSLDMSTMQTCKRKDGTSFYKVLSDIKEIPEDVLPVCKNIFVDESGLWITFNDVPPFSDVYLSKPTEKGGRFFNTYLSPAKKALQARVEYFQKKNPEWSLEKCKMYAEMAS